MSSLTFGQIAYSRQLSSSPGGLDGECHIAAAPFIVKPAGIDDERFKYGAFGISTLQIFGFALCLFIALSLILALSAKCTIFFVRLLCFIIHYFLHQYKYHHSTFLGLLIYLFYSKHLVDIQQFHLIV